MMLMTNTAAARPVADTAWSPLIKSVYLNRNGIELELPLLRLGSADYLWLRFDELYTEPRNFRYRIRHCSRLWEVDDLEAYEFMNGFDDHDVEHFAPSFTTRTDYTHYSTRIPDQSSSFRLSGNYVVEIYAEDQPDSIVLTRRFAVSEEIATVDIEVNRATSAYGNFQRDQEVSLCWELRQGEYIPSAANYATVVVRQNGRDDLQRTLHFSGYNGTKMCYNNHRENVFPGGNTFRYFDISNASTPMGNVQRIERFGSDIMAILRPEEVRARKPYTADAVLAGGMKTNVWNRTQVQTEAEYVWVNFSLPMAQPLLDGSIHVVGELTQWQLSDASRMEWQPSYHCYTLRLLLKQGYYAYQLVVKRVGESEGSTAELEGDHTESPNNYTAYVYLQLPNDRYDRLIGTARR